MVNITKGMDFLPFFAMKSSKTFGSSDPLNGFFVSMSLMSNESKSLGLKKSTGSKFPPWHWQFPLFFFWMKNYQLLWQFWRGVFELGHGSWFFPAWVFSCVSAFDPQSAESPRLSRLIQNLKCKYFRTSQFKQTCNLIQTLWYQRNRLMEWRISFLGVFLSKCQTLSWTKRILSIFLVVKGMNLDCIFFIIKILSKMTTLDLMKRKTKKKEPFQLHFSTIDKWVSWFAFISSTHD